MNACYIWLLCFFFAENRSEKAFFYQELLKMYWILDLPATLGSIWWRYQKNDSAKENLIYYESIFDGACKYKLSWL